MALGIRELKAVARLIVLAAIYFAAAKLGLKLASAHENVSPVWPPTGLAIASLLLLGQRVWPGILIGAFLANFDTHIPFWVAIGIAAGNTLEAVTAVVLLRARDFQHSLDRAKDVGAFIAVVFVATMVSATIGNLSLCLGHAELWQDFGSLWLTWWLGDLVGAIVVAPVLLTFGSGPRHWMPKKRLVEAVFLLTALSLVAFVTFAKSTPTPIQYPLTRLIVPFFLWVSLRLGQRGVALATLILSGFAIWGTAHGLGPFVGVAPNEALLQLQLFVGSNALTFLFLAAVVQERQAGAEALQQKEQQLGVALDAANMGAWSYDVATSVVKWSKNLELLHGLKPNSFGGTFDHFMNDVHPEDRGRLIESLRNTIERGQTHEVEYRIIRPDGSQRWVEGKGQVLRDDDGKTVRMTGVCTDVTERRQAQEEREQLLRREQAARLEAERATENNKRLQSVTDTALQHLSADDLSHEMLERVRELLEVDSVAILLLSEDGSELRLTAAVGLEQELTPNVRVPFGRGIAGRIAASREPLVVEDLSEMDVHNPILRTRFTSLIGAPLVVKEKVIGVIHADTITARQFTSEDVRFLQLVADRLALVLDLAHLYQAEQAARIAAEDAGRMKDEFLATVSHELRTPLNAIVGWSGMLRSGRLDPATTVKALEIIERNAKAQTQLIDDILDVSRIITGKLRVESKPVELLELVEAAADSIRPALISKSISLNLSADPDTGPVLGDPDRLQQVIWNLLSNAVKFTPAQGRIEVRLQSSGNDAEIIVSDTGEGIGASFLPYVFDRFRQADGGTTRLHGGLGLGLAIARHLVELHGGSITASSPGLGQGSTFVVKLRMVPGSGRLAPFEDSTQQPQGV